MAANSATTEETKGPSLVVQIAVVALLTLGAIAAGWFSGTSIGDQRPAGQPDADPARAVELSTAEMSQSVGIVHIDPITTNLSTPANMWIRLELSLVFSGEPDLLVAELVHQDLLAYLRTVKVHQIEGASGFQHLKADLTERAAIRSNNAVSEILIRTLLLE